MQKTVLIIFFLSSCFFSKAQVLFSENFENKKLSAAWHPVSGNWTISDVQELRIAPSGPGPYVLNSAGPGYIRLFVGIPDPAHTKKVKLSLSYYTYPKGGAPGGWVEVEFHKKDLKDGIKGKMTKIPLPVKGRWIDVKRTLVVPAGADLIHLTFFQAETKTLKTILFDNIIVEGAAK